MLHNFSYGAFGDGGRPQSFGYTGRWGGYTDERVGVLNWHRWYGPTAGRWGSRDPIGVAGGNNTYSYVQQNSIGRTDPSGLCCTQSFKACYGKCADMLAGPALITYFSGNIASALPYVPKMPAGAKTWGEAIRIAGTPVLARWVTYLAFAHPGVYAKILAASAAGASVAAVSAAWIGGVLVGCGVACGIDSCSY